MSRDVIYHPEIQKHDLPKINVNIQRIIRRAIERRIMTAPESYGRPLAGNLSGYWKLRVGDYRIIFKIFHREVRIFGILDRKDAYFEILKRI